MLWGCHLIVVENVKIFVRKEQIVPPPPFFFFFLLFLSAESIETEREAVCLCYSGWLTVA